MIQVKYHSQYLMQQTHFWLQYLRATIFWKLCNASFFLLSPSVSFKEFTLQEPIIKFYWIKCFFLRYPWYAQKTIIAKFKWWKDEDIQLWLTILFRRTDPYNWPKNQIKWGRNPMTVISDYSIPLEIP